MTWAAPEADDAPGPEGRGCAECLYLGWGPRLREACTHPRHSCLDATRLTCRCLGCPDWTHRAGPVFGREVLAPVDLRAWCEAVAA